MRTTLISIFDLSLEFKFSIQYISSNLCLGSNTREGISGKKANSKC